MDDEHIEKRFDELEEEQQKTHDAVNEITTILLGPLPGRSNGIRGELRALKDKVNTSIKWAEQIWNVERRKECFGLKAVDELKKEIKKDKEDTAKITTAQVNLKGVYFMGIITLLGQIATALTVLLTKGAN